MSKQWWCGRCGRRRPVAPAPLPSPAQGGAMSHAIPGSRRCAVSLMLRCLQILLLALVIAACAPGAATNGEPIPANPLPFDTGTGPGIVDPDAPLITYTSVDGFVPKRLDVEPGTQVRFYNASSETFWPASNIHPTHAILPELDSKEAIPPGETWDFTFQTRGYWRFHNHQAPGFGGAGRGSRRGRRTPVLQRQSTKSESA